MKHTHLFLSGGLFVFIMISNVAAQQGENLLKYSDFEDAKVDLLQKPAANWGSRFYVHKKDSEEQQTKMQALTSRKISTDNPASGTRCAALITPLTVNQFRDEKGKPEISNRISQNVIVPESTEPVQYKLTFKLRSKMENCPGLNSFRVFVTCLDNTQQSKGKQLGKMKEVGLPSKPDWQENSISFVAPAGTRLLIISLALYGCGEAYIDDIELRQDQAKQP